MERTLYALGYFTFTSIVLVSLLMQWPDRLVHLTSCDVGQGDSYLISLGFDQILIDGGRDSKVLSCLEKHMPFWDRHINLVVASHDDSDHVGGLDEVLSRYKVANLYWNGKASSSDEWQSIQKQAQQQKTRILTGRIELTIGAVSSRFLWPAAGVLSGEADNASSVVNRVSFQGFSVLFTGDIESLTEAQLIQDPYTLPSTVLKVAHHGSRHSTSDEWLSTVGPQLALIGVGRKNSYGHPAKEVLERLQAKGIRVIRSDTDGTVEIVTDGTHWEVVANTGTGLLHQSMPQKLIHLLSTKEGN